MVSVIMPSLNVAEYIDECINSVIHQSLKDMEIICVDAGSTDGTWEKLCTYAASDHRITLIHSDIKSYGYQVNLGIENAQGDYIAIVETDDFVADDMYETLYRIARETDADVVKGDCENFFSSKNGAKFFCKIELWESNTENYNVVMNPRENAFLYDHDFSIWRGIYKRSFLLSNGIKLNESKGAAYQDIGFSQQVLASAERVYYVSNPFYKYRTDRDASSSYSVNGLRYVYQEFKWLMEDHIRCGLQVCPLGFYLHMARAFTSEMEKTLRAVNYDMESEHIALYYEWFVKVFAVLSDNEMQQIVEKYENLDIILNHIEEFVQRLRQKDCKVQENRMAILNNAKSAGVVVFGAGRRGAKAIQFLEQEGISQIVIMDNNVSISGTKLLGYPVDLPKAVIEKYPQACYVVANKAHSNQMVQQLLEMGMERQKIHVFV